MEDRQIIELYFERNEQSIDESNKKYGAYCHTIAFHVLGSSESADECVNDTWWRSWKTIPPQVPKCLRAFFGRITRNLALDRYRAAGRLKRGNQLPLALEELEECVPGSEDVENAYALKELGQSINRFLLTQPKRDRDLFLGRYYYVYSVSEMAKCHGLKEDHVRTILSRMRQKLRLWLEKEGYTL